MAHEYDPSGLSGYITDDQRERMRQAYLKGQRNFLRVLLQGADREGSGNSLRSVGAGIGPQGNLNALADSISGRNRNALARATDASSHPKTRVSGLYFFERPYFYLPEGAKAPKGPWWEWAEDPRQAAPKYDVGPKGPTKVVPKVPPKREPWIWRKPEPPHPDFDWDKFRPWPVT